MALRRDGSEYHCIVGSDVTRDGMYLEVSEQASGSDVIIEIFYSDLDHQMSVTLFKPDVPLEVVEWAISMARQRLPVRSDLVD